MANEIDKVRRVNIETTN